MVSLVQFFHQYLFAGQGHFDSPVELVGLPVLGLAVGYASGLFGVGGGFMLTPLLISLFGVPPGIAVGSGLAQMIVVSITAARKHAAAGYVDLKMAGWMAPGVVTGAFAGKLLLDWLSSLGQLSFLGQRHPAASLILSVIFFVLLVGTALRLWLGDVSSVDFGDDGPLRWSNGPVPVQLPASGIKPFSAVTLLLGGTMAGVMAGLLGVGGGIIVVPLLVYGFGIPIRMSIGTSSALVLVSAVIGTAAHLIGQHVNLTLVAALLLGSFLGVRAGVWHSHRLHVTCLQRTFAMLVLLVAGIVLFELLV
ncbi:MAG: sulfite exporter TauE/SafE family protein [Armatimonadota bacterium]